MGWNELHDEISLYSLSWLHGGKKISGNLDFQNGAKWFISFWDDDIAKQLVKSAMNAPEVCCGMKVKEIQIQENPKFSEKERFLVASPIFIRKYNEENKPIHLTFRDDDVDYYMTETLKSKLKNAGLEPKIKIDFDKTYMKPKTKMVKIKNIENRANLCPVIIEGTPETIQFAWNVGVGHSTGSGFGALL